MQLVQCVPNFSEGRRDDVVGDIRQAAQQVPGVVVLDLHTDSAHNRMVLTFVGNPRAAVEAAFRCAERAAHLIDLRRHRGEHPRIGATDVVPFVPVAGVSMDECVGLATQLGRRLAEELDIPVYLYGRAARRPDRGWLPNVRRGQYEELVRVIGVDPDRAPDFGPARVGPAGATAVGARPYLVAFNVNLASSDLGLARTIARTVRHTNGGLPAVQARGMATPDPAVVQVSLNLLDTAVTPLHVAYEAVRTRAAEHGVRVVSSEIVGLAPGAVLAATASHYLEQRSVNPILEARLLDALAASDAPSDRM